MSSNRKEDILDQALELIIENGLSELTMSKVAGRMGFTEPAMYRHFRNKQDLVLSMIRRLSGCFEEIFQQFDLGDPPDIFLPRYFEALLSHLENVRGVTLLFLSESAFNRDPAIREELLEMFRGQIGRITTYLERAAARDEIRPAVDPAAAALVFMGTVQALTTGFLLSSGMAGSRKLGRPALDVFMKGVIG